MEITYDEKSKVDNVIKAKANEIKQAKLERKPEEIARSKIETTKPDEKKLVEGLSKPVQATKKIEPVKITKSESESSKLKMKPVERAKIPVKPEASKTREPSKKETTSPQPARIKRSDSEYREKSIFRCFDFQNLCVIILSKKMREKLSILFFFLSLSFSLNFYSIK